METIELRSVISVLLTQYPEMPREGVDNAIMRFIHTALAQGDEFYSADLFQPLRDTDQVARSLATNKRVFVQPDDTL